MDPNVESKFFEKMENQSAGGQTQGVPPEAGWTYPTRLCRMCFEDVVPTVTMYPPGLPISLQRPVVEYKNDDEYGRLIKPCLCKGSSRYVHELCIKRARTEGGNPGSMWKCPTCGYQFNFQRLRAQRFLASRGAAIVLTVIMLIFMLFFLGFVADPIINLYVDPYETLTTNDYWHEIEVNDFEDVLWSSWSLHFLKGFVSMGVVGFLKVLLLNPWHWWNWRNTGLIGGSRRTATTGQDRAINISWIAVAIGVCSAIYLFYQWVQALVAKTLQRIGNTIVDTQLPGDDDDIKPPQDWVPPMTQPEAGEGDILAETTDETDHTVATAKLAPRQDSTESDGIADFIFDRQNQPKADIETRNMMSQIPQEAAESFGPAVTGLEAARRQGWSFGNL